jgi:putative hydrolase of the HAD superfamily
MEKMSVSVKSILFDLVGVLVEFRGPEKVFDLSQGRVDREMFARFWNESPWAMDFSRGICPPEDFAKGAVEYFGLSMSPENFIENYKSWYVGPYPGALSMVKDLKDRYTVGCLSNINEIYVPRFIRELQLDKIMDHCIFSNEVGVIKPDLDIFYLAARRLNMENDAILFFDDSQTNVDAAQNAGMQARRVDGPKDIQKALGELGILHAVATPENIAHQESADRKE